jgi:DNA-binding transcriptional MerR regulator
MLGIGEFARRGRISVRMLRHYDAMGLLAPAHVDEWTGRRGYEVSQLARLNRLVVLKELGFTLQQVKTILDEVDPLELHGMLRLRRMELEAQIDADVARLAEVEARLRAVDEASGSHDLDVTVRTVEPLRVAVRSGVATSYDPASISPVVQPLFDEIIAALDAAHLRPVGPALVRYERGPRDRVCVDVCFPVEADLGPRDGFAVVDLPPIHHAAIALHHGPPEGVMATIQSLASWIDRSPYRSSGGNREVYLDCAGARDTWVLEIQEPLLPGTAPSRR